MLMSDTVHKFIHAISKTVLTESLPRIFHVSLFFFLEKEKAEFESPGFYE